MSKNKVQTHVKIGSIQKIINLVEMTLTETLNRITVEGKYVLGKFGTLSHKVSATNCCGAVVNT